MVRPRKPVDLLVYEGKSHRTKEEISKRKKTEVSVPYTDIRPPRKGLTKSQKEEFMEIADKLVTLDIFTELDVDTLTRYLISKDLYFKFTRMQNKSIRTGDLDAMAKIAIMQDKAFKQCRNCASDLGLTISSRCKLVVPQVEEPKENKFMAKFGNN